MTINEFQLLEEMEKVAAIMQHGRLLAQDLQTDERTFLYRFDTFYVLTRYGIFNDALEEITSFSDVDQRVPHFRKRLIAIHPASRDFAVPEKI